jgi:1-acyl-sn-glycerol-3-phosphate acyltransferase
MMKLFTKIYYFFLTRRYKVTIKGQEILNEDGPKLILPNHPAYVDAQLLGSLTSQYWKIAPVVSEKFVNMPIVGFFLRKSGAVPVSDLKYGNRDPHVLDKIVKNVGKAFENGRSAIVYPAGQIKRAAHEKINNKQTAFNLVSNFPSNVPVIGVRITGLWGSMWSTHETGVPPKFWKTFAKSTLIIFGNLVFFCPKRKVSIEFVDITVQARECATGDRKSFNTFLEGFYNVDGAEKVINRKRFFFMPGE